MTMFFKLTELKFWFIQIPSPKLLTSDIISLFFPPPLYFNISHQKDLSIRANTHSFGMISIMERNATRYAWMVFDFYICTTINYFKNKVNIIAVLNHRDWELKRRRIRRVSAKHFQFWKKILLKKKSTKLNSNYLTKLIKNHVFVLFYFIFNCKNLVCWPSFTLHAHHLHEKKK